MTLNEKDKHGEVKYALTVGRRLYDAFEQLRNTAATLGSWQLSDEINRVEQSYSMMMKYVLDGIDDPGREQVYKDIEYSISFLQDCIKRESLKKSQSPRLYFSTLRYVEMQRYESLATMISDYKARYEDTSIYNVISGKAFSPRAREISVDLEMRETQIFNKIWVTFPLTAEDATAIEGAMMSQILPLHFRHLILSAVLLGLLEYYDQRRMTLLLTAYQNGDEALAIKALCAVVIALSMHHGLVANAHLANHIAALREQPQWHSDVKMVYMQLIKARDTERINRKMQDELLPDMMKLRPELYKSLGDNPAEIDIQSIGENPEWQEMLDKSGLADKMRELSELQQDGSDVFMSTFSHLKSYSFFSTVSNWFVPFYVEQTDVVDALGADSGVLGELIASSPFLCNSDKYSFALSMKSVPASHREMMMSQLDAHNVNLAELQNTELFSDAKKRENIAARYVQDLYRFFKLHRSHNDFIDPFDFMLEPTSIPLLSVDFKDADILSLIGEFYFKRKYYNEAFTMFSELSEIVPPSAQLFQKMGYAKQQAGDIASALCYYEQSELLNAENVWTLRRIAACHRLLGNTETALDYYNRIDAMLPDDTGVAMSMGNCLLLLSRYEDALRCFYKVEFLDANPSKAWRSIAWCLLMTKDYRQSMSYFEKLIGDAPQAVDFLNMGHLYMAKRDYRKAVNCYRDCLDANGGDRGKFMEMFTADMKYLDILGVDINVVPFIIDAVYYDANS